MANNLRLDKLRPNDPRATKRSLDVGARKWSFLDAKPHGSSKGTVVLVHGFPDLSFGWRYQIPLFLRLGFRCIALDCMGYGDTGNSTDLKDFTFKVHAEAIAAIAENLGVDRIVIGGHDWGGVTVYRVAQWFPSLVTHVFSVCTSFMNPTDKFIPTSTLVETALPQFGYQLQLGSTDSIIERAVKDEKTVRKFLNGLYGGHPLNGGQFMNPRSGIDLDILEHGEVGKTPLLDQEELDYYVGEFSRNGVAGPCNWYRTRQLNWRDDLSLPQVVKHTIHQPTLYILATKDDILTREMSIGMERAIPSLTRAEVKAGHWALWQKPRETNDILERWFRDVVLRPATKL